LQETPGDRQPLEMPELQLSGEIYSDDAEPSERSLRVQVANETDAAVDAERIEAAVQAAFAGSAYSTATVSVAIVDDEAIHALNRQFLDHDYPTDVLSFPLEDAPPSLEGEIVVSFDTAIRCAAEAGWSAADELLLYVVHGALHLAGYRDKVQADADEMRAREAAILAGLGVPVPAHDSRWHVSGPGEDESR
jgi:probable rRNA maturation factor